jgi:ABC-type glycerol-3-phosphate transport system substrate-binding protein
MGEPTQKSGLVVPIEEFILGPDGLDAESVADFLPSVYEPFNFDGVQWFLPLRSESSLLSYNKDLFREIGIEAFPETWDSFRESMRKIAADLTKDSRQARPVSTT